ncbi:MAG TPA: F0F1 ATP synthase subunit gamma [Actinomycetota bacterium]|nr:F0F1 ATP synthase subunit gamma [Actinomycetota bacterium]
MGAKLRETRRRIRSIQSTKKITKAMELIAASRIIRAERRVRASRPFSDRIGSVIRNLAATTERLEHPLLERHEGAPTGLIVITADRGLAGAYNANVLRLSERTRRELGASNVLLYAVGRKAVSAFRFRRIPMEDQWVGFSETPSYQDAQQVAERVIDDFLGGRIGSARILYTEFASMFTQRPVAVEVLPVSAEEIEGGRQYPPIYEFEPAPADILGQLLPTYIEVKVYQALLESAASEHAARRRAMSSATENAEELIRFYTRVANQARQAEITSEIADIVGGAEALRS